MDQTTWVAVTSPFPPARIATVPLDSNPPVTYAIPSPATTLGQTFPVSRTVAYQRSFPVSGSSPHTSPGAATTNSLRPSAIGTRVGDENERLRPAASAFQ